MNLKGAQFIIDLIDCSNLSFVDFKNVLIDVVLQLIKYVSY